MNQREAMDSAARVAPLDRAREIPWLRSELIGDAELGNARMIRAAQVAAAWLPATLRVVLDALESGNPDRSFAVLCALTDVSLSMLVEVEATLVPAIWGAMLAFDDEDGSVVYIGASLLGLLDASLVRSQADQTGFNGLSTFFLHELRDKVFKVSPYSKEIDAEISSRRFNDIDRPADGSNG